MKSIVSIIDNAASLGGIGGPFYEKILRSVHLSTDDVRVLTPFRGTKPTIAEVESLLAELRSLRPGVVLAFGLNAVRSVLRRKDVALADVFGVSHMAGETIIVPLPSIQRLATGAEIQMRQALDYIEAAIEDAD